MCRGNPAVSFRERIGEPIEGRLHLSDAFVAAGKEHQEREQEERGCEAPSGLHDWKCTCFPTVTQPDYRPPFVRVYSELPAPDRYQKDKHPGP